MRQSTRLRNFSPRLKLSTARMSSSPRWLSALTMLQPMKPAAPVTTIMRPFEVKSVGKELFGMHHRGTELAHYDAGRLVGPAHGLFQIASRCQHRAQRCN